MFRRAAAGTRLAVGGAAAAATCTARATRCPPRATEDIILPLTEGTGGLFGAPAEVRRDVGHVYREWETKQRKWCCNVDTSKQL